MRLTASIGCSWAVLFAAGAAADTKTFDNDDGDYNWFADANWDPDGVPGLGDVALVDADDVVLALEFMPLEANRLEISSGLRLSSASSLYVTGNSVITGLDYIGPNPTDFVADGPLAIDGACDFQGTPIFRGASTTTIGGTIVDFHDGLIVDDFANLVLAGTGIEFWDGFNVRPLRVDDGAECRITGEVVTQTGGIATNGTGACVIDGGTLTFFPNADLPSSLTGNLEMSSGKLVSANGTWTLSNYDITGGTVAAMGGGIEFQNFDRTISASRFEGSDVVVIRSGSVGGNPIEELSGDGELRLLNTVALTTNILNNGSMLTFGSTINGPGVIQNAGTLTLTSTELNTQVDILGNTVVDGTLRTTGLVNILGGGELRLLGSITPPFGETPGPVRVEGELIVDNRNFSDMTVPLNLADGRISVTETTLNIRGSGTWTGGQIRLVIEEAENDARVTLFGGGGLLSITGEVEVFDESVSPDPDTASLFNWGVASGPQPVVEINQGGVLSFDLNEGRVLFRADEAFGDGRIEINQGTLFEVSRNSFIGPTILNMGELRINSQLTAFEIDNRAATEQRNTVRVVDEGRIVNSGVWLVSGGNRIEYEPLADDDALATYENTGTYAVPAGAGSQVDIRFNNAGTVLVDGGTGTFNDALIQTQTPDGQPALALTGRWIARNGGRIFFSQGVFLIGVPQADPADRNVVEGDEDAIAWIGGVRRAYDTDLQLDDVTFTEPIVALTNSSLTIPENGNIACNDYRWYDSGLDMGPGSTMTCTGSAVFESCEDSCAGDTPSSATLKPGATLEAQGGVRVGGQQSVIDDITGVLNIARFGEPPIPTAIIAPLLDLYAILRPSQGEFGSMNLDGDLLMRDSARIEVKIGAAQADRLDVTGLATLAGTVAITLAPDYTPAIGDEVIVMTVAGGFAGAIATVDAPADTGVRWRAHTVGTELRLIAACPADLVAPFGVLDLGDIGAFVTGFQSGDPIADLDGNGIFDLADIGLFVGLFAGGC